VTVLATASNPLRVADGISGTIGGISASATRQTSTRWALEATMGASHPEGAIEFAITMRDMAGNSTPITQTDIDDNSSITYDKTLPTIIQSSIESSNDNSLYAIDEDTTTLIFTIDDEIIGDPTVLIMNSATVKRSGPVGRVWNYYLVMDEDDHADGQVTVSVNFIDKANNSGDTFTHDDISSTVTYDETAPHLTYVSIKSSQSLADSIYAKPGDRVTLSFNSSD